MGNITKPFFLHLAVSLILVGIPLRAYPQRTLYAPGVYYHRHTGVAFPESFDSYTRKSIISFSNDDKNIGVNYLSRKGLTISVFVYPADAAFERRLRDHFIYCLRDLMIANQIGANEIKLNPFFYSRDGYRVPGLQGTVSTMNLKSVLRLYECGKYFLKFRISAVFEADTIALNKIASRLTDLFSPVDIVKAQPLLLGATVNVAPGLVNDSAAVKPVLTELMAKSAWIMEHVDSLERCAGFPSLYFEEQRTAITAMLDTLKSAEYVKDVAYKKHLECLQAIRASGFLN